MTTRPTKARRYTLRAYTPAMRLERIAYLQRQPWLSPQHQTELTYLLKLQPNPLPPDTEA